MQCLVQKEPDWKPEEDDQDIERESICFLTGVRDGHHDGDLPTFNLSGTATIACLHLILMHV